MNFNTDTFKAPVLCLAPMAGVTDTAFRNLCFEFKSELSFSEMVSAKALTMGDQKSLRLCDISSDTGPCVVQLFGNDPKIMAKAAKIVKERNPELFAIDINMGCPAPKIFKNGSGSALLLDKKLAGEIVFEVKDNFDGFVSAKMRLGVSQKDDAVSFARELCKNGLDLLTVHGRTREQMYSGEADLDAIGQIKQAVSVPVFANGDIKDARSAENALLKTNCDGIMIGRGAQGRPWVFSEISAHLKQNKEFLEPTVSEKMEIMLRHVRAIINFEGERHGMLEARKHAVWYTKGIRGAVKIRQKMQLVTTFDQLVSLTKEVIKLSEEN